jgi:DNA modification methylase
MGIGSTGYVALKYNRRFIGGELKRSYYQSAIQNLTAAEQAKSRPTLFAWAEMVEKAQDG